MTEQQPRIPHHIEAAQVGADIRTAKCIAPHATAAQIRETWDYRAAGLTVDAARDMIERWREGDRSWRHPKPSEPATERILALGQHIRRMREQYQALALHVSADDDRDTPTWDYPEINWTAGERRFVTRRQENVTWSDNRNRRYPTSSRVTYTTYLLREDYATAPHASVLRGLAQVPMSLLAEAQITHDTRGDWHRRVAAELLPGVDIGVRVWVRYKALAVEGDVLMSIYDGSVYELGMERSQTAKADHRGGYYTYPSPADAAAVEVPNNSQCRDLPRLIVQCEVWGRAVAYDNGKEAHTHIRPVAIVG